MASRDIAYESSSDEDIPEPIEFFRSADLPIISNPTPYDSNESSSSESGNSEPPSSPSRPTTPASPAMSLGAAFSYVGLSSQTSEDQISSTPKLKRKRQVKRKVYPLKKGQLPFVLRSHKSPGSETVKVSRPTSCLYKDIHFETDTKVMNIKICSEGLEYSKIYHLQPITRLLINPSSITYFPF